MADFLRRWACYIVCQMVEGLLWRGGGGARVYRSFCNKNQVVGRSNNYCWLKKIRHPKLRSLPLFCVREDAGVWAHWDHSFNVHLSYLGPAFWAFSSWVPSGCTAGEGEAAAVWGLEDSNILCLLIWQNFPGGSVENNPLATAGNARDVSLIPGLGRSSGGGNGNPLQDSCLESSVDRGAWQATVHGVSKTWTWLSTHNYTYTAGNSFSLTSRNTVSKITMWEQMQHPWSEAGLHQD